MLLVWWFCFAGEPPALPGCCLASGLRVLLEWWFCCGRAARAPRMLFGGCAARAAGVVVLWRASRPRSQGVVWRAGCAAGVVVLLRAGRPRSQGVVLRAGWACCWCCCAFVGAGHARDCGFAASKTLLSLN